jgi:hypothetical protein
MIFLGDINTFHHKVHTCLGLLSIEPAIVSLTLLLCLKRPGKAEDIADRIRGEEGWKWFSERACKKS